MSAALVVTYTEAARLLSVSVSTIERRVKSGELRAVRVLGMPRVPVSEIERVLGTAARALSAEEQEAEAIAREMVR